MSFYYYSSSDDEYCGSNNGSNSIQSQTRIEDCNIVYFDLSTTQATVGARVVQIAAKFGSAEFNKYIQPNQLIPQSTTDYNGIEVIDGKVYHCGEEKTAFPRYEALVEFNNFLFKYQPVLLATHNSFRFDGKIIIRQMKQCNLFENFNDIVYGFIDTFPLFREYMPNRYNYDGDYKLKSLARFILCGNNVNNIRNALFDTRMLVDMINEENFCEEYLKRFSKTVYQVE